MGGVAFFKEMQMSEQPGTHAAQRGEGGHQGSDRQPGKDIEKSHKRGPEPAEAAGAGQVQDRSKPAMKAIPDDQPDMLHPGPGRLESEKDPGDVHRDQGDGEEEMK